ncbi:Superfamily II DNA and RNA helicase [Neptunomonas antarctica]|uniref:ATP-dependent RNA helicase RhlB n=1 Tax=Neptunomonas antarctica TaxID=619304 RepID=A0A1N7K9X1_9GAMM|nr:Superfamily II DNA and RNA helicase [Neptunomonas antarctica]
MTLEEFNPSNSSETTNVNNAAENKGERKDKRRPAGRSRKTVQDSGWVPNDSAVAVSEGKKRFHDFSLPDQLMHAIHDLGFEYCTPIQADTIKPALAGKDIIGKAQTGTGKTAAFLVGIITDLLDFQLEDKQRQGEPRALIIAPTRELALQIAADAVLLCKYTDINVVSIVGGMDYEKQRKELKAGPVGILVATPGRLIDFVRSKEVDLHNVEVLVLDEADRMLSMGFIPDVRTIIRNTPRKGEERQTLLYSATFTDDVMNLARQWTHEPVQIEIEAERRSTDNISQKVFLVASKEKYRLLRNYIRINNIERVIVFGNRRHETRDLAERLKRDGVKAALMSGEIPQHKRVKTLEDFKSGKIEVLVATDVAGRGIHIDGVTHVVNYQLPEDAEDYVHRIGRTGRAGATGTSICFACENDSFMIPEIEAETGVKLECIHPTEELLADPDAVVKVQSPAPAPAPVLVEPVVDAEAEPVVEVEPVVEIAQVETEQVDVDPVKAEQVNSAEVADDIASTESAKQTVEAEAVVADGQAESVVVDVLVDTVEKEPENVSDIVLETVSDVVLVEVPVEVSGDVAEALPVVEHSSEELATDSIVDSAEEVTKEITKEVAEAEDSAVNDTDVKTHEGV